jgi:hypothetical protein
MNTLFLGEKNILEWFIQELLSEDVQLIV